MADVLQHRGSHERAGSRVPGDLGVRPGAAARRHARLPIVMGLCAIALGLAGAVGVATRTRILIQIVPSTTPIRFNTALCLFVAGAGLIAMARSRRGVTWLSVAIIAILAGLTALEYLLNVDLEIDELFVRDFRLTVDQLPRMAPNTVSALLVAALALGLANLRHQRRWMPATLGLAAVFVASVGSIAIIGYLVGMSSGYRWGEAEPIAVITSVGFVVLGVGLFHVAWQRSSTFDEGTPRWLPWAIAIGLAVANVAIVESIVRIRLRAGARIEDVGAAREVLLAVGLATAALLGLTTSFALAARRQASRVRREAAFSHQLLDGMDDLRTGVVLTRDTAILFVNDGFCRISGYSREELLALPSTADLVVPERRVDLVRIWDRLLTEPENAQTYETTILAKDGSRIELEVATKVMQVDASTTIMLIARDVTERKRAEELRRQLTSQLIRAQEEERRRIASNIHDDPVQKMAAVGIRLDLLRRQLPDAESREAVDSLSDVVHLAIARLRQLLFELRPPALERGGLADTIQRLEQEMGEAGVELHVDDRMAAEPSGDTSVNAYRIVQEALANVRKHARAGRATVVLETKGRSLHVRIEDDGVGATPERFTDHELGHMGIAAMRERAELAGGWCIIEGVPGRGTTVECVLPTDVTARTAIAHVNRRDASRATSAAGPGSL